MPWWAWLTIGAVLVAVELTAADLAFYFIFLGAAAILVGLMELGAADLPIWGQWLLFAVLAVTSMALFRDRVYKRLRGNLPGFDNSPAGAIVDVANTVERGGETRIRLRGSQWSARNVGDSAIAAGAQARVVGAQGTVLEITALADVAGGKVGST